MCEHNKFDQSGKCIYCGFDRNAPVQEQQWPRVGEKLEQQPPQLTKRGTKDFCILRIDVTENGYYVEAIDTDPRLGRMGELSFGKRWIACDDSHLLRVVKARIDELHRPVENLE